jgi:hypothetical protein
MDEIVVGAFRSTEVDAGLLSAPEAPVVASDAKSTSGAAERAFGAFATYLAAAAAATSLAPPPPPAGLKVRVCEKKRINERERTSFMVPVKRIEQWRR